MKHNFDASVSKDLAWQALSKAVWRYKMTYIILGDMKNNIREFEFYWPLPCTILTKNSLKVARTQIKRRLHHIEEVSAVLH